MAVRTGILYDEQFRPIIRNGGFAVGPTLTQECRAILASNKGNWKHAPLLGPDLIRRMKGNSLIALRRAVKLQLEADGKRVRKLQVSGNGQITLDASET